MAPPDARRVRLSEAQARALAEAALRGAGCGDDETRALADHMVDAALCGYEYSGLPKILNVDEYRRRHPPVAPITTVHETPVSARLDGGGHNGMWTVDRATDLAIARAAAAGFAVVGVARTYMSGRGAYYVERIARAGLIGIHTVSSRPQVAPPGAAAAAIGTNPIAFGFPTADEPLLIDLGTSALMFTDLALRARRGERLPDGVALDADGAPTTDPLRALAGAVLPFGGADAHKGFALALAMQALGVLAHAGDDDEGVGYVVLALQPTLMMPLARYREALSAQLARIRSAPRRDGVDAIRIPSERSYAARARHRRDGIEIDAAIRDALARLAGDG